MATVTERFLGSGWTASQFRDTLRLAFIDAGWMTEWHDTISTSHGIMRMRYGTSGTYRDLFYVFYVDTSVLALSIGGGWDDANNVYTGTQYLDFHTATPPTTTSQAQHVGLSSANAYKFTIYKSTIDPDFAVIYCDAFTNGEFGRCISLVTPGMTLAPWIDLNKVHVNGLISFQTGATGTRAFIRLLSYLRTRRSAWDGAALRLSTSIGDYYNTLSEYLYYITQSSASNAALGMVGNGLMVPSFYAANNPAFSADEAFIVTGYPFHPLTTDVMPSDFGLWAPYGTTQYAEGDIIQVAPGTNEWRVICSSNQSDIDRPSLVFLARIV